MSRLSRAVLAAALAFAAVTTSQAAPKLEVGYMPIIPVSQAFVVLQNQTGKTR